MRRLLSFTSALLWLVLCARSQAADATPFLVAPVPVKEIVAALGRQKIVIEGTRVLLPQNIGVSTSEARQEFQVKSEIVYVAGRGLAITNIYTDAAGEAQKDQILVLELGTLVINHSMRSAWLIRNDSIQLNEAFFWLPEQQLEAFGLAAELKKSETATLRIKDLVFTTAVTRDGKNLTAVISKEGDHPFVSVKSKYTAPGSLPVHTHREEFGKDSNEPWRTDDVLIRLVPWQEEDDHALAIIVPPDYSVTDTRKDPKEPLKRRGYEIGELLKDEGK